MSVLEEPGRFLTGSTFGHVARMSLAGTLGFVFVFAIDAMNLFWLSRIGDAQVVAAAGFAFAVQFLAVSTGIGLMIAAIALVSRSIGAGDRALARRQTTSATVVAGLFQIGVALLFILFRHQLLALLGAQGDVAGMAARYLAISMPSLGLMGAAMVCNGALRALGDARLSVAVTLGAGLVAGIVDPVLIYGLGWGIEGAAIGVNIARLAMLALALRFVIARHDMMAPLSQADFAGTVRPFFAIAGPAILTQMARPLGTNFMIMVIAQFGDDVMAGWAVVNRLIMVAFGGLFPFAAAVGGIFGQNFGAAQFRRIETTYRDAVLFGLSYVLVSWAALYALTEPVIRMFDLPPAGAEIVRVFTHFGGMSFVFGVGFFVSSAAFNALGRPGWATAISWLRDGILTWPMAALMAGLYGAAGVVYSQVAVSLIIGTLSGLLGAWFVFRLGARHTPATAGT